MSIIKQESIQHKKTLRRLGGYYKHIIDILYTYNKASNMLITCLLYIVRLLHTFQDGICKGR
jgi:hypothetical protein